MKKNFLMVLSVISLLSFGLLITEALADTSVGVSVTMPEGTIGTHISKILAITDDPAGHTWPAPGTPTETTIEFPDLTELVDPGTGAKLGVFGPSDKRYYAIDLSVKDGGYPPFVSVNISFDNPTLGAKMLGTFAHVVFVGGTPPTTETTFLGPQALSTPVTLTSTDFTGVWTRMYVGMAVPPAAPGTLPPGVTPWTATDASGGYSGSLVILGAASPT